MAQNIDDIVTEEGKISYKNNLETESYIFRWSRVGSNGSYSMDEVRSFADGIYNFIVDATLSSRAGGIGRDSVFSFDGTEIRRRDERVYELDRYSNDSGKLSHRWTGELELKEDPVVNFYEY